MQTIRELQEKATVFLKDKKITNYKESIEVFLSYILNIKKSNLQFFKNKKISQKDQKKIWKMLYARALAEPVDYILKYKDFYDCKINLNKNVLIPRQETEIFVDKICEVLKKDNLQDKILLDMCSGSGCLGLAIKKKFLKLQIYLVDICKKALNIAGKNAKENDLEVFLKKSDLFNSLKGLKIDYFICNPPYVSYEEYESLDFEVKAFEPKKALVAKDKGLEFYKRIEKEIKTYLSPKAKLFFEIGQGQAQDILDIFSSCEWKQKRIYKDFSSKDRFFFVEIE